MESFNEKKELSQAYENLRLAAEKADLHDVAEIFNIYKAYDALRFVNDPDSGKEFLVYRKSPADNEWQMLPNDKSEIINFIVNDVRVSSYRDELTAIQFTAALSDKDKRDEGSFSRYIYKVKKEYNMRLNWDDILDLFSPHRFDPLIQAKRDYKDLSGNPGFLLCEDDNSFVPYNYACRAIEEYESDSCSDDVWSDVMEGVRLKYYETESEDDDGETAYEI